MPSREATGSQTRLSKIVAKGISLPASCHAYAPADPDSAASPVIGNVSRNQIHPPELRAGGPPKKEGFSPCPLCSVVNLVLERADLNEKDQ
jgi:hypothetical protein